MSEIKIFVKNFEIIKDTKLVVDGIVGIVGESNNGKSAIYNAIKTLAYNIQGTGYIRQEKGKIAGATSVGIQFEDKSSVVFEKLKSPSYILGVDGVQSAYDKVGRSGAPEDIAKVLNMEPLDLDDNNSIQLNFLDQFQTPILQQLSEFQLYKVAVKSYDGEKIQEAIKVCKADHDSTQNAFRDKELIIEVKKKERVALLDKLKVYEDNDIKLITDKGVIFNKYVRMVPVYRGYNNQLVYLTNSIEKVQGIQNKFEGIYELKNKVTEVTIKSNNKMAYQAYLDRYNSILSSIDGIESLASKTKIPTSILDRAVTAKRNNEFMVLCIDFNNKAHTIDDSIGFVYSKIASLAGIGSAVKKLSSYKENVTKRSLYEEYINKHNNLDAQLNNLKDPMKNISDELKAKKKIVEEGLCPLCENKVGKHKHNEDMNEEVQKVVDRIEALNQKYSGYVSQKEMLEKQKKELSAECLQKTGSPIEDMAAKIKEIDEFNNKFVAEVAPKLDKMEAELAKVDQEEYVGDPNSGQFPNPNMGGPAGNGNMNFPQQ